MPTLLHRLFTWAKEDPQAVAQTYKDNAGVRRPISVHEYALQVWAVAQFLRAENIGSNDVTLILGYNCPAWPTADLAPGLVGAMSAGLYPNSSFQDIEHILQLTQGKILFLQNKSYWDKATQNNTHPLPASVRRIVVFDNDTSFDPRAIAWSSIIEKYRSQFNLHSAIEQLASVDPHRPAFIIFTSGTTGRPKGSMLSHDNLIYVFDQVKKYWPFRMARETAFSFLPLCHIAEKMQNLCAAITIRARADFCTSFEKMPQELLEVRPTVMLAVPRLWEKMIEGVNKKLAVAPPRKRALAEWALATGRAYHETQSRPLELRLKYTLAKVLILNKIKKALGLENVFMAASGAALLRPDVVRWFRALDIHIQEVYGQTESAGVICITQPHIDCAGTVGLPCPGVDVELASDGEILARGRGIFKGYLHNPEATNEVLINGVLHTGDLGQRDAQGRIKIIGRKKEIMKTSGGKMIAPAPIEERMKECGLLSQACMVGEGRKFFSMVVTLAEGITRNQEIIQQLEVQKELVNRHLASFEQIKYVSILSRDFSIEQGELTPTMKVKRAVVERNFAQEIEMIYTQQ